MIQRVVQCVPEHEQGRRAVVGFFWPVLSSHNSSKLTFYEAFKEQGILESNVYQFTIKSGTSSQLDEGYIDDTRFLRKSRVSERESKTNVLEDVC